MIPLDDSIKVPVFEDDIQFNPKEVTAPSSSVSWTTGGAPSGGGGSFLTDANTTELNKAITTLYEIYSVLKAKKIIK